MFIQNLGWARKLLFGVNVGAEATIWGLCCPLSGYEIVGSATNDFLESGVCDGAGSSSGSPLPLVGVTTLARAASSASLY